MPSLSKVIIISFSLALSSMTTSCIHKLAQSKVTSKKGLYTAYTFNAPKDGGMLRVVLNPTRTKYLIEYARFLKGYGPSGTIAYEYHMGSISMDKGQMILQPEDVSSCYAGKQLITAATPLVQSSGVYSSHQEANEADAVQLPGNLFERYINNSKSEITFVLMPGYEKADMRDLAIKDGHLACFSDSEMDVAPEKRPAIDKF